MIRLIGKDYEIGKLAKEIRSMTGVDPFLKDDSFIVGNIEINLLPLDDISGEKANVKVIDVKGENIMFYNFEDRFKEFLEKDNTADGDVERKALFYILAGNLDLYRKANYIYDFKDRSIKPECLESEEVDFCSSSKKLIRLAYNLYNSYPADVMDTFSVLDEENFELALNAIEGRFRKGYI